MGVERYINKVDEDPETRTGSTAAGCPPGVYTLRASVSSADNAELASASAGFFILSAPVVIEPPTLTALSVTHGDPAEDVALSPAFDGATLGYDAEVGGEVAQITIVPTGSAPDVAIAYVDGNGAALADANGVADGHQVNLRAGLNTIKVVVSDDTLTVTYSVNVLRLVAPQQQATGLTISSGTLRPEFDRATTEYRAAVKNNVGQVTVTATVAAGDTVAYLDSTGGALADADGGATGQQVDLGVGETTFQVKVTRGSASKTYTVVMERDSPWVHGWTPTKDINGLFGEDNTGARGVASNGTTTWVGNYDENKLYAYANATGVRDSAKDIMLDAISRHNIQGLWTDNTTIWVAGLGGKKVFAYTLSSKARDEDKEFNLHADNRNRRRHLVGWDDDVGGGQQ